MKKVLCVVAALSTALLGCDGTPSSDTVQREAQEKILAEGTAQVGMPAIKNFRERKILKDIFELRDQEGLVTYTYFENMVPTVVPGKTALGGKLTYLGESVGYAISAATQFTNPQKPDRVVMSGIHAVVTLPQADPNGLFSPASAEGSWVLMRNPKTGEVEPQYSEPRLAVFTFKLPFDGDSPPGAVTPPASAGAKQ